MLENASTLFSLRPLEKADLATVAHWFQDVADLAFFDRNSRFPYDLPSCERQWEPSSKSDTGGDRYWFSILSDTDQMVGMIGLEGVSSVNRDAVIPLYIDKSTRRMGVGIRAAALMLDFAFRQLGLHRVTSYYRADNLGSRDLTKRAGFEIEGTMRQSWFADGTFHDMIVVGLLHDEWKLRREVLANQLGLDMRVTFGADASTAWTWPPHDIVSG